MKPEDRQAIVRHFEAGGFEAPIMAAVVMGWSARKTADVIAEAILGGILDGMTPIFNFNYREFIAGLVLGEFDQEIAAALEKAKHETSYSRN